LSQFKKYHPSGNLIFNYLGIFQSLKLRILMEKILSMSLKPNYTKYFGLLWVNFEQTNFISFSRTATKYPVDLNFPVFSRIKNKSRVFLAFSPVSHAEHPAVRQHREKRRST